MPHDPTRIADTRAWLTKASHDLQAARAVLDAAPALPDVAIFHCQQAVEKAFKAFLFWHDVPFRKTHELEELGDAAVAIDATFAPIVLRSVDLTPFAWRFRYPGIWTPRRRKRRRRCLPWRERSTISSSRACRASSRRGRAWCGSRPGSRVRPLAKIGYESFVGCGLPHRARLVLHS